MFAKIQQIISRIHRIIKLKSRKQYLTSLPSTKRFQAIFYPYVVNNATRFNIQTNNSFHCNFPHKNQTKINNIYSICSNILNDPSTFTAKNNNTSLTKHSIRSLTTGTQLFGAHSSVGHIKKLIMKHPAQAFISQNNLENTWEECLFIAEPNFKNACKQFDNLLNILRSKNIEPILLPQDDSTTIDSIHTHDSVFVCDKGYIPMQFAKPSRISEVQPMVKMFEQLNVPHYGNEMDKSVFVEAGDFIWLNKNTVCVGNGYRTDSKGICELRRIFGESGLEIIVVDVQLPHFEGPTSCLHLLSACSPLSADTWLIYKRAVPVVFLRFLEDYGIKIIEVPDEEWHNWGSNVLAIAPGELIATEGNPETLKLLRLNGMDVTVFHANDICALTGGGPTCITRPVLRETN